MVQPLRKGSTLRSPLQVDVISMARLYFNGELSAAMTEGSDHVSLTLAQPVLKVFFFLINLKLHR